MKKLLLKLILLSCIIRLIFKLTVTLCKDKQFCNVKQKYYSWVLITDYRRPMKPFFIELLGLGTQIGQINSGTFGVFLAELSVTILVQWVPYPCFPLFNPYFFKKSWYPLPKYLSKYVFIWDWDLNLGLRVSVVRVNV